jgi:cytochrome c
MICLHSPEARATRIAQSVSALRAGAFGVLLAAAGMICGCTGGKQKHPVEVNIGGSAQRGQAVMVHYGCGKCHTIPGIPHARGVFGPPLNFMGIRTELAGNFPNTPENLVHWIEQPTAMKPKTAMPDLGLTEQQARDAAAYLETLH